MRAKPLILKDALKTFSHDQDKMISPAETIQRFNDRLAITGLQILDDIVRIDNGRLDIPVYFSICGPQARAAIGNYKQMGKGATPEQAQASAVMELGERFSLFSFYGNKANFVFAPLSDISEPTLGFDKIAQSVDDASEDREIAQQFFSQLPLQWTWAHSLTRGDAIMIPFNWFWTINQFNGSCAGNGIEEALCQGISEVVERHVSSVISHQKRRIPLINPDTIQDPVVRELIGKYRANGIELILSDFTLDMGIPSVGALAWDPATFPDRSEIVWTAGTMPSAEKALCRALTEVAQLAGDFNSGGNYEASGLPKFRSLDEARHVTEPGLSVDIADLPNLGNDNIKIEVENFVEALAVRNMDVLVVDVTHPDLSVPAFYTIIPGTRFRERAPNASVGMIVSKIITETYSPGPAVKALKEFDAQLPNKYYIQFYLGLIHLNQGTIEAAVKHLTRAIELEPPDEDLASIYTYLGVCHKESEQFQTALSVLEKADHIDSERTDTLNLMGFCHYKLQDHARAIDCFEKLITLDPSSAIDYANIASNYRAMGKKTKAIEYYQLALKLDDTIEFAREHLAQMGVKG
jgi:ribosomal protein S12 methylthiotransferase accessory factor